jgi:hypothetical protein
MENKREPGGKKQYDNDRAFELCKEKSERIRPLLGLQSIRAKDSKSFLRLDPGQAAEFGLQTSEHGIWGLGPEGI